MSPIINRSIQLVLLLATCALATVPQRDRSPKPSHLPYHAEAGTVSRDWPAPLGPFSYLREFDKIIRFQAFWQQDNPSLPHYGGMIEAEGGPLGDVIQTDNTLEAIWCWSRWRQLTGSDEMDAHLDAAWIYCQNYPAWAEEGGVGDNYYRNHNSAWALAACDMYEEATGDTTYRAYGRTCATYIAEHPMFLGSSSTVNAFVTGWCAGSLYEYALRHEREDLRVTALAEAERLFEWIMVDPETRLALDDWAMSSGTMVWGIATTLFRERPLLAQAWHFRHAFDVPEWSHWRNIPGYDWDSSWNVAYANGLFTLAEVLGDPVMRERAVRITDGLLSWDVDDDGGIMADTHDPPDEDMSWVSCYLARFCVDRMLPSTLPGADADLLRLDGLLDEEDLLQEPGLPTQAGLIVVGNGSSSDHTWQVTLELNGNVLESWSGNLAFAGLDTLDFAFPSDLPVGRHEVLAYLNQDDNSRNDTLRLHLWVPPELPASRVIERPDGSWGPALKRTR